MKKILILLISLFMFLSMVSCKKQEEVNKMEETNTQVLNTTIEVIDQIGRQVILEKPCEKIVSTYYLVTASLLTLGLKDKIYGIEMKANTRNLYKLAAKDFLEFPAVGSGKEINIEEIAKINPDIVFLPKKQKDSVELLSDLGIQSIVVDPENYDKFNELISIIGKVCGIEDKANKLINYYDDVVNEVSSLTKNTNKPSVYIAGESSYLRTCSANMYQSQMIEISGGECVSNSLNKDSWTDINLEQLIKWDPEYIFIVNYAEYSIDDLLNDETLKDLQAIKNNNVYIIPSKIEAWDYPQPSSVLGLYWMAGILHPDLVDQNKYLEEALTFYKTYYNLELNNEDF